MNNTASLSAFLQSPDFLGEMKGKPLDHIARCIRTKCGHWFSPDSEDVRRMGENLEAFGLASIPSIRDKVIEGVMLHYAEKLFGLLSTPETLAGYLGAHVDGAAAVGMLRNALNERGGVLVGTAHFGGVELIAPFLALHKLPVTVVLRYATGGLSAAAKSVMDRCAASGLFSAVRIIEIGNPSVPAALEMAAVLRRKEVLLAVFDESTPYDTPVLFRGKKLPGGSGLGKLLTFVNAPVSVAGAFMIREGSQRYVLNLNEVDNDPASAVASLYSRLAVMVEKYPDMWYLLHEKIEMACEHEHGKS